MWYFDALKPSCGNTSLSEAEHTALVIHLLEHHDAAKIPDDLISDLWAAYISSDSLLIPPTLKTLTFGEVLPF